MNGTPRKLLYSPLDMNGRKIHEVGAPTEAGDAANKEYVDSVAGGGGGGPVPHELGELSDVDTSVREPVSGDRLTYWAEAPGGGKWVAAPPAKVSGRVENLLPLDLATTTDPALWTGEANNYHVTVGNHPWTPEGGPTYQSLALFSGNYISGNLYSPKVWPTTDFPVGDATQMAFSIHIMIPFASNWHPMYKPEVRVGIEWAGESGEIEDGGNNSVPVAEANKWVRYTYVAAVPTGMKYARPTVMISNLGYNGNISAIAGAMLSDGPLVPWVPVDGPAVLATVASDIHIDATPAVGEVLTYSGDGWIAAPPASGEPGLKIEPNSTAIDWAGVTVKKDGTKVWLEGEAVFPAAYTIPDQMMGGLFAGTVPTEARPAQGTQSPTMTVVVDISTNLTLTVDAYTGRITLGRYGGPADIPSGFKIAFMPTFTWSTVKPPALTDLTDVQITMPTENAALLYQMGKWVNKKVWPPTSEVGLVLTSNGSYNEPTWQPAPEGGGGGDPFAIVPDPANSALYDVSELQCAPTGGGWQVSGALTVKDPSQIRAQGNGVWQVIGRLPGFVTPPPADIQMETMNVAGGAVRIESRVAADGEVAFCYMAGAAMAITGTAPLEAGLFVWGQPEGGEVDWANVPGPVTVRASGKGAGSDINFKGDDKLSPAGRIGLGDSGELTIEVTDFNGTNADSLMKGVLSFGTKIGSPRKPFVALQGAYGADFNVGDNGNLVVFSSLAKANDTTLQGGATTGELTLNGSKIVTEAALAAVLEEVAALKAEVETLRARLGDAG